MPDGDGAIQLAYDISQSSFSVGVLATFITLDSPKYFSHNESELREAVLKGFAEVHVWMCRT